VARPDVAIALNQPSFDKYEFLVKPGGLLVVNSSIVSSKTKRKEIEAVYVPANTIAEELGTVKMLNMAAVGAMLRRQPVLDLEVVEQAISDHLPPKKAHLANANLRVMRQGFEAAAPVATN
jgi:2-oxoglutarate ferredoxin oxidoreductase subunit gamma